MASTSPPQLLLSAFTSSSLLPPPISYLRISSSSSSLPLHPLFCSSPSPSPSPSPSLSPSASTSSSFARHSPSSSRVISTSSSWSSSSSSSPSCSFKCKARFVYPSSSTIDDDYLLTRAHSSSDQQSDYHLDMDYASTQSFNLSSGSDTEAALSSSSLVSAEIDLYSDRTIAFSLLVAMGIMAFGSTESAIALGPEGPLLEEFWDNMRRYGLYFLTVATGGIYSILEPVFALLRNPLTAILTIAVITGSLYLLYLTLNIMLGISAFDYKYSS